jgi:hypothetical protein
VTRLWHWLLGLLGGREERPVGVAPSVVELLTERTRQSRTFAVRLDGKPWEVAVLLWTTTALARRGFGFTVSVKPGAAPHQWWAAVEYNRTRDAAPDPLPPGEPLTTDALRSLCAGAGTDGAVVFTSEGGWRRAQ